MITTTIKWHSPADDLPEATTDKILIYNKAGYLSTCSYSSRHKLFNASDYATEADAKMTAIYPRYWAYNPVLPETESEAE